MRPRNKIINDLPDGPKDITLIPAGIRNRAIFSILAFTGCRVGELTRLKVGSCKSDGVHRVLEIHGTGGKERLVTLNPEVAQYSYDPLGSPAQCPNCTGSGSVKCGVCKGTGKV
jgi:site-specific recombinase XerD